MTSDYPPVCPHCGNAHDFHDLCGADKYDALRECAIHAAVIEMSMFSGNLEMKVRKAIERYEFIMGKGD